MRKIDKIVIHCTDTRSGRFVSLNDVRRWHVEGNGWSDIGYHYLILLDGSIEVGRDLGKIGAHCFGHNSNSIGICYVGGGSGFDTRNFEQKQALKCLVSILVSVFGSISVHGHNEFSSKSCPNFDVSNEF